uniref:FBA_2 domain-containing protein n=1 Tax=Caenorhabditis tropicalis TaxID=1561998 RepID=A0A1I7UDT0_9PELO
MNIPFFRAPQIVQSIIVNLVEPNELICLTQCSKRTYNLVKTYWKTSEDVGIEVADFENVVKVYFDGEESCRLGLDSNYGRRDLERDYPPKNLFGADFRLSLFMSGEWNLEWNDPTKDGVLTLIDWTTDLFRADVGSLFISKDYFHRLKWVESRQEHINELYLSGGEYSEEEIRCVVLSKADNLLLNSFRPNFTYPGILPNRTSFVSGRGFLFTPNHLMTSDYVNLSVRESTVTNVDLNQFLKHWLAGGCSRLKTLILGINENDLNEITRGIEGIIPNRDPETEVYWTILGRELTFKNRVYLRRSDGVIATCGIINHRYTANEFVLAVWPDAKNNACLIDN